MKSVHYRSLDGLRAVAVAIVLLAHAGLPYPRSGGVGVDIFFVLSGFLITGILSAEAERYGNVSFRNFYVRRFLRLAPCLVLTCAFFAAATLLLESRFPGRELAYALTYTSNWARGIFDVDLSSLGHTWSLAIEEQYYLMWPFTVLVLERMSKNAIAKGAALLAIAVGLALYRWQVSSLFSPERIYFGLDTHMDGLVLGSALSYVLLAINRAGGLNARLSALLGYVCIPLALALLVVVMARMHWTSPWMMRSGFFVIAVISAFIIADLVAGQHSLVRGPLSSRPAVYVGRISYGLYLWHLPLYQVIDTLLPGAPFAVLLPLKLASSLAVASASFFLVEQRFLELKVFFERAPDIARRRSGWSVFPGRAAVRVRKRQRDENQVAPP